MRASCSTPRGRLRRCRSVSCPVPEAGDGWVLIEVKAFGLNRSELHTRLGLAGAARPFRGCSGSRRRGGGVAPGGEFAPGQQVVAMMGGMGRVFDGGYAEYTCVPAAQVIPFESGLDWATIGAVPETLQTAYGSLTVGPRRPARRHGADPRRDLVGRMTLAVLAKQRGMTVFATTRDAAKGDALRAIGVDEVLIDDGELAERGAGARPGGVDRTLDLIGAPTLRDSLLATRVHGVSATAARCQRLGAEGLLPDRRHPLGRVPDRLRRRRERPPASGLQAFLDDVAAGRARCRSQVYALDRDRRGPRRHGGATASRASSSSAWRDPWTTSLEVPGDVPRPELDEVAVGVVEVRRAGVLVGAERVLGDLAPLARSSATAAS